MLWFCNLKGPLEMLLDDTKFAPSADGNLHPSLSHFLHLFWAFISLDNKHSPLLLWENHVRRTLCTKILQVLSVEKCQCAIPQFSPHNHMSHFHPAEDIRVHFCALGHSLCSITCLISHDGATLHIIIELGRFNSELTPIDVPWKRDTNASLVKQSVSS